MVYLGEIWDFGEAEFTQENLLELSKTLVGREIEAINVHISGFRIDPAAAAAAGSVRQLMAFRPGVVVSDGVSGAAGAADADQEDDDSAEQEAQDPLVSVLIDVTVIGHSINRKTISKFHKILLLLLFLR